MPFQSGTSADPSAQKQLLNAAQEESVQELKQRCDRVKTVATPDETQRYNRTRARRRLGLADAAHQIDIHTFPTEADSAAALVHHLNGE